MNPLIYLAVICTAGAGIALTQQRSIDRAHQRIARLSEQLVTLRNAVDADNASLEEMRGRWNRARLELHDLRQNHAALVQAELEHRTPEHEGWWPANRDYFYLRKNFLSRIRFRTIRAPIDQVNALLTKRMAAVIPNIVSVQMEADSEGQGTFESRLFEGGCLDPDIAALFGLDDSTKAHVEQSYAELERALRELEANRIQRVDPPQPAGTPHPGRIIVARIPDLSDDVAPLWTAATEEWRELLGENRANCFIGQVGEHVNRYRDKLGRVSREFILDKSMLIIQYNEPWGKHQSLQTIALPVRPGSAFDHLFGPGAPCELK